MTSNIRNKKMVKMTGGQALAKSLYREGVRVIFGLPGVQLYHMMDGLYDEPGIRFITVRHEQATAYMADGYARASGEIGTALMVPGPGLLNASAGVSTAYSASSPVLVVCGQIERDEIGGDRGMLHEVNDQLDAIRPVTKWAHRIMDPAEVPEAVHQAFHHLKNGRPRPVEIEIPPETLAEVADVELLEPEAPRPTAAGKEQIEAAATALAGASNPLIWAGGGVISAQGTEALTKLAEFLQAPVVTTAEGKGAISDHHPLALGALWLRNDTIAREQFGHDVILAVGTRLVTSQWLAGQQVVQIDVDPEEIGRHYENTLRVEGDARLTMEELLAALSAKTQAKADRTAEVAEQKAQRSEDIIKVEPQGELLEAVRRAMPEDSILISGMTQMGYYSRAHYPVYEPRTFITSSYSGNLGYAYPTALGAKVAQPDKAVVCLSGDGGFMFNSQEMSTAVAHNINVVVVVFNDNAYGNVKRDQVNQFNGRTIGVELHNPDFVKLAEAYGAKGFVANGPAELEATLKKALTLEAPVLIEVPVGPMPSPFFKAP
jgi:acetolactate synthase-1/2/3 large subunit